MSPEHTGDGSRGLAPGATPSVVYGILGVILSAVPIVGFLLGWMAYLRSRQSMIQLDHDARLEGRSLQRWGGFCGVVSMVLGIASTVVWLVIFISSLK
ncbi:MAG: hypothetical protein CMJ39_06070 [Phycisphaerae bacterium]|nr:hypothetical protein [Phycisphaerae bacterium]